MSQEFWIAHRDVSYEQLTKYLKLTRSLPALYQLVPRGSRALALNAFWDICAKKLNAIKGGAIKSATGWSQYLHYVRFRIKQRITEITSGRKISRVPEDDYIPISELDRMIFSYLNGIEDQNDISYEFDPTESRYWEACAPQPAATRKRRLSASDIVIKKRKKQMPEDEEMVSEGTKDKNAKAGISAQPIRKRRPRRAFVQACKAIKNYYKKKPMKKSSAPAGVRGRKSQRSADAFDFDIEVPAIRRRSQSFTDMSDAIEYDRKLKLEMLAERTKSDPEAVKKREEDRIKYVRFVTLTLRANLIDSLRILSFTSVLKEILKNNPQFQKTICETPTFF